MSYTLKKSYHPSLASINLCEGTNLHRITQKKHEHECVFLIFHFLIEYSKYFIWFKFFLFLVQPISVSICEFQNFMYFFCFISSTPTHNVYPLIYHLSLIFLLWNRNKKKISYTLNAHKHIHTRNASPNCSLSAISVIFDMTTTAATIITEQKKIQALHKFLYSANELFEAFNKWFEFSTNQKKKNNNNSNAL